MFEVLPLPVDWGSQVQFLLGAQLVVVVVILLVWEYLWEEQTMGWEQALHLVFLLSVVAGPQAQSAFEGSQ